MTDREEILEELRKLADGDEPLGERFAELVLDLIAMDKQEETDDHAK